MSSDESNTEPEDGTSRYEIRTRRDVLAVFSALARSSVPVTTSIAQLGVNLASRLVAFNPAFEELVFDATGLAGLERLDGSGGLAASAQMDAVWFRFEATHVEVVRGYAHPAFRARMPSILMRMQRRDSIRYPLPGINSPVCDVLIRDVPVSLRAIDISLSGVALSLEGSPATMAAGSVLENCRLHLPKLGAIQTDLVVMHTAAGDKSGRRRMGCRFSNLLTTSLIHLQRYIAELERERLASDSRAQAAGDG